MVDQTDVLEELDLAQEGLAGADQNLLHSVLLQERHWGNSQNVEHQR